MRFSKTLFALLLTFHDKETKKDSSKKALFSIEPQKNRVNGNDFQLTVAARGGTPSKGHSLLISDIRCHDCQRVFANNEVLWCRSFKVFSIKILKQQNEKKNIWKMQIDFMIECNEKAKIFSGLLISVSNLLIHSDLNAKFI